MRKAIVISLLLHASLLLWAFGSFVAPAKPKKTDAKSMSVEVLTASEFTQLKKGVKHAKVKDKKRKTLPKKKKPVKKAAKPKKIIHAKVNKIVKKAAHAASAPKPEVKKTIEKKLEVKTETKAPIKVVENKPLTKPVVVKVKKVEKKPEVKKVVKPKPVKKPKPKKKKVVKKKKPKPKKKVVKKKIQKKKIAKRKTIKRKKKFNPDSIAAILNKIPDAGGSVEPDKPVKKWKRRMASARNTPVQGRREGRSNRVTASEIDFFRAQVSKCWSPPVGGLGSGGIIVKLRLKFEKNGSLRSMPRLLNRQRSTVFVAAADSAIRAVWQCQPYTMPAEKYAGDQGWHDMILNFNPSEMHSGY